MLDIARFCDARPAHSTSLHTSTVDRPENLRYLNTVQSNRFETRRTPSDKAREVKKDGGT